MRTLSLAISPCPNDTFIFDALIHGRLNAGTCPPLTPALHDVDRLNAMARQGEADIVKISLAAYPDCAEEYVILRAGAALGHGVGPVLVSGGPALPGELSSVPIAVPGLMTTANLLLTLTGLFLGPRLPMRYDLVLDAVASNEVPAGVVIHEGRFTYAKRGLHKIMDLGAWWEQAFGVPLPLGVIVARRSLGAETIGRVQTGIRRSLEHARAHPGDSTAFVARHAQELVPEVVAAHIGTFVTDYSLDLGHAGERAVRALLTEAFRQQGRETPEDVVAP